MHLRDRADRGRPRRRSVGLGRTLAVLACMASSTTLGAFDARADTTPTVWEHVQNAGRLDTYRLHLEVQRRLASYGEVAQAQLGATRSILESVDAEHSPDVRLRFDLARVYETLGEVTRDPNFHRRAATVVQAALRDAPDHPMAEEGWTTLAYACGHLADHVCERNAYLQVLRQHTEENMRLTPTLNLAETEMHLGNLREAIDVYREAIRIANRVQSSSGAVTGILAVWGLSVALDRSGDHAGSEREARFALQLERSIGIHQGGPVSSALHGRGVFFVPAYEVHWYDGLSASTLAKDATRPEVAAQYWAVAERSFESYVKQADAREDLWFELAKIRLATAKAARQKAEAKARSGPRRPLPIAEDQELSL